MKADDGITDLYGVMYKPFDFDPAKKYPIIAYVYPGPQTESVTKTFTPRSNQHVAGELRLHRDRDRQSRRQSAPLEVVPHLRLRQPARLRPGRQEGGDRAARGALPVHRHRPRRHLGPLRRRLHVGGGDAHLSGLLQGRGGRSRATTRTTSTTTPGARSTTASRKSTTRTARSTFEYTIDKNSEIAKNLKGHLMLITGDIDNNVHPGNTSGWPTR